MEPYELLQEYSGGATELEKSLQDVQERQFDQRPIAGTWSIRQVVCHLADAEIVYAERMKRVLTEDNPTVFDWSPDASIRDNFCSHRNPYQEVELIAALRIHMRSILEPLDVEMWHRTAVHSSDGPMTLETLLENITHHIPHHIQFIEKKKSAMEST